MITVHFLYLFCQGCIYFVKTAFILSRLHLFCQGCIYFVKAAFILSRLHLFCQGCIYLSRPHLCCQGCIYFCEGAVAGPTGVQGAALPQIWEWRRRDGVPGHAPSCPGQYMYQLYIGLYIVQTGVADPWHFWCGSGSRSADPWLWLMDLDPDPDPSIFITGLQDANKKLIFFFNFLRITFRRYFYIIFSEIKSWKEVTKQ